MGNYKQLKKLSARAELLLGIVREATRFNDKQELQSYFVPRTTPIFEVFDKVCNDVIGLEGIHIGGSGDAVIFRALEHAGLIKAQKAASYSYSITEDGIAKYEEIAATRRGS